MSACSRLQDIGEKDPTEAMYGNSSHMDTELHSSHTHISAHAWIYTISSYDSYQSYHTEDVLID